jgi:hypothetical protein
MVHDLEQALAIEARRGADLTEEATTVLRQLPGETADWVPLRIRNPRRVLALVAVGLAVAAVVIAILASRTSTSETGDAVVHHVAAGVTKVAFADVKDYDPFGDNKAESPNSVKLAIDGNRRTYWATEHYSNGLQKPGVGLWVSTSTPVVGTELDLISPFAGWQGAIYATSGAPPADISGWKQLSGTFTAQSATKIKLDSAGNAYDHFLVWITKLAGPQAGIMEVSLLAQKR